MTEDRHATIGLPPGGIGRLRRLRLLGRAHQAAFVLLTLLGIGAAIVIGLRMAKAQELAEVADRQTTRHVIVTYARPAEADRVLRLPATLQGSMEAPIYARTNGYATRWFKDIGEPVKRGELLAQIDTPEVGQQLNEAKAALAQAQTNLQLARSTHERWHALRQRDAVSQQDLDERSNALAVAVAADNAARATVRRLEEQLGYSRVVAPFDGIVTRRNIDVGTLVDAGGSARPLFTVAKSDPLRVYIYVPQNYAAQIKPGIGVDITLSELPGRKFAGSVVRTAGAIDLQTRTLQVEVSLPNPDGALLPGAYVQAAIKAERGQDTLTVPSNTLLFRPQGPQVAVAGVDGKVLLKPVTITRELGAEIEVTGALQPQDRLIINPADSLSEGEPVQVAETRGEAAKQQVAPQADKPSEAPAAPAQPAPARKMS